MPLYFASHTTACLTKQSLRRLMLDLLGSTSPRVRRCVASQLGGRMLTEVEAENHAAVERFFEQKRVNCEWIMRIDLDGHEGVVTEY